METYIYVHENYLLFQDHLNMKGQSEIAYLPKFANMMLVVMMIVITEIL